jgi:hypothetical protein
MWRPIRTVFKDPLAIAAAGSVEEEDLVEASVIYRRRGRKSTSVSASSEETASRMERRYSNSTWTVLPNPNHKWYYKNEQQPDEVWFVKCFDSWERDGLARRAPHCAFRDTERDGAGWPNRESVDVRAVVVYE